MPSMVSQDACNTLFYYKKPSKPGCLAGCRLPFPPTNLLQPQLKHQVTNSTNFVQFLSTRFPHLFFLSFFLPHSLLLWPQQVAHLHLHFPHWQEKHLFLLLGVLLIFVFNFKEELMSSQLKQNPGKALEGIHGVHMLPHSPFEVEEGPQCGYLHLSSSTYREDNQRLFMQRLWQQRPACFRPIHCCLQGDRNFVETIANVLTSLPFIALGMHAPRKNLNTKLYANSLIGVGVASSLYHSSRGELRKYLRWADYTMIATATVCLSNALRNENPKLLMAATALFLPVQPLMVSAVHTGLMEVAFAKRALSEPELRMAHNVHKMSSLLGGVLFIADDVFPSTPYLHAAWHLAAAIGVGTCNKLLE